MFPVIDKVPVEVFEIPYLAEVVELPYTPRPLPVTVKVFPDAAENERHVVEPALISVFTVSVLPPVDTVNDPPATAVVPAIVRSDRTVMSWSIVIAFPLA